MQRRSRVRGCRRLAVVAMAGLAQLVAVALGPWPVATASAADTAPRAATSAAPHRIVLIYDFPRSSPAIVEHERAFNTTLKSISAEPVNVASEYLSPTQVSGDGVFPEETVGYLRAKYARSSVDLIVLTSSRMLRFVLRHRPRLFSGIPIVFSSVDQTAASDIRLPADVTGIWLSLDWAGTYETALELQPETTRVVVIGGSSPIDGVWMTAARAQLERARGPVDIDYLSGMTLQAVLDHVAVLPARTVALLGAFTRDASGREFYGGEASARIAAAAPVPVYTLASGMIGSGVVGGHVVSFEAHGQHAARLATEVLRGERPPPRAAATNVPTFDARQIRRWGLDARRLPGDSVLLYDEPSAWTMYRRYVVGGAALVLVQSGLIATLLVQRAKRRRAEGELADRLRFETLLADLSALFATSPVTLVDTQIQTALGRIGDDLGVDRVTVAEYSAQPSAIRVTHAWTRAGAPSLPGVLDAGRMPWIDGEVRRGQDVCISCPDDLPVKAARDHQTLTAFGTRSLAILPLVSGGSVAGFLALTTVREERQWGGDLGARLRLLADVFAGVLARQRADQAIEETRRHREELAHVQRVTTLGELAAGLAHEINQPLAAIVLNAQATVRLLGSSPGGPDGLKDVLTDIIQDSTRASQVIRRLRAMFRNEHVDREPLSMNTLIENVVPLLHHDFQHKRITVRLALDPATPRLLGDAVQLQQVLLNVLINAGEAIDAADDDGPREIAITTRRPAANVLEVIVHDTGVGVPEGELEHIFTRFVSDKRGGLGMGLTICRSIVEQHGGRIWATRNPDHGLSLHIELPLDEAGGSIDSVP